MPRRAFLLGAATTAIVTACSGSSNNQSPEAVSGADSGPGAITDDTLWLQAAFADGLRLPSTLAAGRPERAPFVLYNADGVPAVNGLPAEITMTVTDPGGVTTDMIAVRRDEGIPTPYFILEFEPPSAGFYTATVDVTGEPQQVEFGVAEPGDVGLVSPGEPMRPVSTPTFADAKGFDPVCTRFDPCPFHEISLDEAIANGRPTVLQISTPGYCQSEICGPVLELLIELDPSADMNVVHAEVYNEPARINEIGLSPELLGPAVTTYSMDFEPSLVVADAAGIVTARLDYAFDMADIRAALATV